MAFDVDQFLAQTNGPPPAPPTGDGTQNANDIINNTAGSDFDVDSFLKTTQDNAHLPNPAQPESSYGDVLSQSATNAKLGLMQSVGGLMQGIGEAPTSAIQELAQPAPSGISLPYNLKQLLAKGEIAATALPAALAPDAFSSLADTGKTIQQEATAEQRENQPNVAPGSLESKVGLAAQMGLQLAPTLLVPEAIPEMFGAQGFGSTYAEQRNAGQSGGNALLPSVTSGIANGAIGELPLGVLTSETGGLGAKLLKGAIVGEVTGQGLNAVQQGINKGTIDPNMTWDQFKQSAEDMGGIGAVLGAAGAGISHIARGAPATEPPAPPPPSPLDIPQQAFNPQTGRMEDVGGEPPASPPPPAGAANTAPEAAQPNDVPPTPSAPPTLDDKINSGQVTSDDLRAMLQNGTAQFVDGKLQETPASTPASAPIDPQSVVAATASGGNVDPEVLRLLLNNGSIGFDSSGKLQANTADPVDILPLAQNARLSSLDNLLSQLKSPDSTGSATFDQAVSDFQAKNKLVDSLKSTSDTPIAANDIPHSDIESVGANLDAISANNPQGLNAGVLHDLINTGFAKIGADGHPEMTDQGVQLHNEIKNPSAAVTPEEQAQLDQYLKDKQPKLALPSPDQFPSGVIAADSAGNARMMNQGDMAAIERAKQQAEGVGLTPDVLRAQAQRGTGVEKPAEIKALPSPESFPSNVIATDSQGNARRMTESELAAAQGRAREQNNLGLTPDILRAQQARNEKVPELTPMPASAPETPARLPSPESFPSDAIAVDRNGNARRLTESEVAEIDRQRQESENAGLTPDVIKAQADRAAGEGAGKQFSATPVNPDEARLAELEREHDALPPDSPRKAEILSEMEAIGDKIIASTKPTLTDQFGAKKQAMANRVTSIIRRINPDVDVKVVRKLFGEGEGLKDSGLKSADRQEVAGSFEKLKNLITASLNTEKWNPLDTAYHEAYHSVRDMIRPADDAILKKAFPGTDKLSQEEHEAVEFGRFMTEKNATGFIPAVRRIFSSVRQAMRDIGSALKLGKFNSVEDIFNRVERGGVYGDYVRSLKGGDIEALKGAHLPPDQQRQAVREASPALYDAVYKAKGDDTAFKRWFGDSKVVDKNGDPLTVYHGSGADIEKFNTGGRGKTHEAGAFFSSNPHVASTYALGENKNVSPVHLSLENPVVLDANGKNWNSLSLDTKINLPKHTVDNNGDNDLLSQLGIDTSSNPKNKTLSANFTTLKKLFGKELFDDDRLSTDDISRWAKQQGYDGVIINNVRDHGPNGAFATEEAKNPSSIYVAFKPEQIKSTLNRGSYDPNDARIQYSNTPKDDALDRFNAENNGTPTEKLSAYASGLYDKATSAADVAKEKMLRASVDALKPIASEKFIKEKLADVDNTIAKTGKKFDGEKSPINGAYNLGQMLLASNDGRMRWMGRAFDSKVVPILADMWHPDPGSGHAITETYPEEMSRVINTARNTLAHVYKDLSRPQLEKVTYLMQHPELMTKEVTATPEGKAAAVSSRIVQDMRDNLAGAGYEVPEVQGFFPRIYDTAKVVANEQKFKQQAKLAYLDTYKDYFAGKPAADVASELNDMTDRWFNNVSLQDQGIDTGANDFTSVPTSPPAPSSFKARTLSKAADDIMRDYLVQDPVSAMSGLIYKSARKAAWESRLGGGKWEMYKDQMAKEGMPGHIISNIAEMIKSNTGQMGLTVPSNVKNALSVARYYGALRYLSKVAFLHTSLPLLTGIRTGNVANAFRAYHDSIRALLSNGDAARNTKLFSEMLGLTGQSAEHMLMMQQMGDMPNEKLRYANDRYYDRIGITKLVSAAKQGAIRPIQYFISHLSDDILNHGDSQKSSEFLSRELGIPSDKLQGFAQWVKDGGGKNMQQSLVLDRSDPNAVLYQTAMRRAMDQIIQNPTPATRQLYANHPVGSMIYSLGAYKMAYAKNVLQRAYRMTTEAGATGKGYTMADRLALATPAMMLPLTVAFAAAYEEAKDAMFPPDKPFKGNKAIRAIGRSELFGEFDGLAKYVASRKFAEPVIGKGYAKEYAKDQYYSNILGPNASLYNNLSDMVTKLPDISSGTKKQQQAETRRLYDMVLAPAVSGAVATYSPYALPAFGAIQAINSPQVRRRIIGGK